MLTAGRRRCAARQGSINRQAPVNYVAGLLVDGLDDVPDDHDVLVGEGDAMFVMFHQGAGRAHVYLVPGLSGRHRFAGSEGTQRFLDACRLPCYPYGEQVASATPIGPIATYPGDDTWTDAPYVDGVVLIGDAAGYNDPIIGEGLSIAIRDTRIVRDLVLDGARQSTALAPYGSERAARMERLRFVADLVSVTHGRRCRQGAASPGVVGERDELDGC